MSVEAVLAELAALGTEQNRRIFARHGVGARQFGVTFGNLTTLKKSLKIDHPLAEALWTSGYHEARLLATMIADPARVDEEMAERWAADLDNYILTDALVGLIARTPVADQLRERWLASDEEWRGRAGWTLLSKLAIQDRHRPPAWFVPYLATIESTIHTRPNRVREAMNNTLIAMGIRDATLESLVLTAAARIGPVQVDHGETACETPDVASYIRRIREQSRPPRSA